MIFPQGSIVEAGLEKRRGAAARGRSARVVKHLFLVAYGKCYEMPS